MLQNLHHQSRVLQTRLIQMASQLSNGPYVGNGKPGRMSLANLPKSNVFTSKLPADPAFETPESSHKSSRKALGPRLVKGALFTYVRPEPAGARNTKGDGCSRPALRDYLPHAGGADVRGVVPRGRAT